MNSCLRARTRSPSLLEQPPSEMEQVVAGILFPGCIPSPARVFVSGAQARNEVPQAILDGI